MGAATRQPRERGSRRGEVDLVHPMRRLFGESRGVAIGVMFVLAVVGLMLVRPVAMSFLSWHRTAALLTERRAEVAELDARHDELTEQVTYFQTNAFVAEKAREYGMAVPGEKTFVIREVAHPESASEYAIARLRNATVDHPIALAGPPS